jgi:hypothetical protein
VGTSTGRGALGPDTEVELPVWRISRAFVTRADPTMRLNSIRPCDPCRDSLCRPKTQADASVNSTVFPSGSLAVTSIPGRLMTE